MASLISCFCILGGIFSICYQLLISHFKKIHPFDSSNIIIRPWSSWLELFFHIQLQGCCLYPHHSSCNFQTCLLLWICVIPLWLFVVLCLFIDMLFKAAICNVSKLSSIWSSVFIMYKTQLNHNVGNKFLFSYEGWYLEAYL